MSFYGLDLDLDAHSSERGMSARAFGLLMEIKFLEHITNKRLAEIFDEGAGAIGKAMQELKELGYLYTETKSLSRGRIVSQTFITYEGKRIIDNYLGRKSANNW